MAQIREALANAFQGIDTNGLTQEDDGRVTGFVVWDGFSAMQQDERQSVIWQALRARVSSDVLAGIGLILTLTNVERAMYLEAAA